MAYILKTIISAKKFPLLVLACAALSYSSVNIVNFSSVVTTNAFVNIGDTMWVATSGGLVAHDMRGGGKTLISGAKILPDLHLTSLCRDRRGNLWTGSLKGYLYKRTPRGQFTAYSNYKTSGWGITALHVHGDLIVVGSDRGVSLFDPGKGVVIRNAPGIADFDNPRVNVIAENGDTLFLGCDEGVAYIDSLNVVPLAQRNFYYPGIWKTRKVPDVPVPVVSLVDSLGAIVPKNVPAAMFRGHLLTAEGNELRSGDTPVGALTPFSGKMTVLRSEGDRQLWIGTDERYYFSFDGQFPQQHVVEGLALRSGSRVAVAGNGDVWVLSKHRYHNILWYHGVYRYDSRRWHLYNGHTHGDDFGYVGDADMADIAFSGDGTVWVGTAGGNVKRISPSANTVRQLVVGYGDFVDIGYYPQVGGAWGGAVALAVDSSGYLWSAVAHHNVGSIICHDPRVDPNSQESDPVRAGYRWFFTESPYKTPDIKQLSVDIDNRIFAYDEPQSRLTIFRHNGNPLKDSIVIDTSYAQFGTVSAIRCAPDGATYIVGVGTLRKIGRGSRDVVTVESGIPGLSSLAIQDAGTLWLGSVASGIARYSLDTREIKWIGEAQGLPSDNVTSIAIDARSGYLWALTENVVSRVDVGRTVEVTRKEQMLAFPNVFSISGKTQGAKSVTFTRLEPQSTVSVYTVNGILVAKVNAEYFTEREWRAAWTPKRNLAPGTYMVVAAPSGKRTKLILKP